MIEYDFNHMLPEPYDRLPQSAKHRLVADVRETLFRQGTETTGLYIVLNGCVHLERVGPNGERFVIHRAMAGTSFAEASIFSEHYHCDALVIEAGKFVRIDKAAVLTAFADVDFARAYGRQAARQIQAHRQLLEIVGIRSAEERVMAGLVAGLLDGQVVDFAALLNLSHEATYRALRSLVRAGKVVNPSRGVYHL
ncbi:Crp/Fnr family transcriptional regulator [Sulfitobacter mediterraneus]|uniref:Crp/Fnr family transcriptional regulator n=1 Tax=Sulfitobacter mediterraneus TaxID=83219 RepID=UPI001E620126|nr:Crp/Fnr family transcriptional regulator [Sulfitobacter mediterraneus]MCD2366752.1 Crp/Fnr family transcriptional regulator [Sulfitobacter mediterraneus]